MNPAYAKPTFLIALVLPVLMLGALGVLGSAIGWPDSLRLPPAEALPLIAANSGSVRLGYGLYLGASVLQVALAACLVLWLGARHRPLLLVAALAGVLSGVFKLLGIGRWLAAMPGLAENYGTDPAAADLVFHALNRYAGETLGEGLGTALFMGIFHAALAAGAGRSPDPEDGVLPLGLRALFAVTALISLWVFLALFGVESGSAAMLSGWFQYLGLWVLAGWMLVRARGAQADPPAGSRNP